MKTVKLAALTITAQMLLVQQVLAVDGIPNGTVVPEMDGSGAIIAIGLVAGLVALVREKFFRK